MVKLRIWSTALLYEVIRPGFHPQHFVSISDHMELVWCISAAKANNAGLSNSYVRSSLKTGHVTKAFRNALVDNQID